MCLYHLSIACAINLFNISWFLASQLGDLYTAPLSTSLYCQLRFQPYRFFKQCLIKIITKVCFNIVFSENSHTPTRIYHKPHKTGNPQILYSLLSLFVHFKFLGKISVIIIISVFSIEITTSNSSILFSKLSAFV